jgi:hypothetical protein
VLACQLFASSAARWEREVEEGSKMVGRAGTSIEEARRRESGWRSFMLKFEQDVERLGLKVVNLSRDLEKRVRNQSLFG